MIKILLFCSFADRLLAYRVIASSRTFNISWSYVRVFVLKSDSIRMNSLTLNDFPSLSTFVLEGYTRTETWWTSCIETKSLGCKVVTNTQYYPGKLSYNKESCWPGSTSMERFNLDGDIDILIIDWHSRPDRYILGDYTEACWTLFDSLDRKLRGWAEYLRNLDNHTWERGTTTRLLVSHRR